VSSPASWAPPYGAPSLTDLTRPIVKGLRQTALPLQLTGRDRDLASDADRFLPPLPPGQYEFIVDKFDAAAPALLAIEPGSGSLLLLLPESREWMPIDQANGGVLAECTRGTLGWRAELVRDERGCTCYVPTDGGLAAVRPRLLGLSFTTEYFGEGVALGGPVAWAGEVWIPIANKKGGVSLIGRTPSQTKPITIVSSAPVPADGFGQPVFDARQIIWPSQDGQLIVRLNQDGKEEADWIDWPVGVRPAFSLGSPYLSARGTFWQCCINTDGSFEYVQMGQRTPERAAVDAPRFGTGNISYKKDQRIKGDPWREPEHANEGASAEVIIPLLESVHDSAVVALRVGALSVLDLLESENEHHRAVLQLQADASADALFGTLIVPRPWLTSVFAYDGHLWIYHPELRKVGGWKLDC
jgi:hypothetical protein